MNRPRIVEVFRSHRIRHIHLVRLLWTKDQLSVEEAADSTYTRTHAHAHERNIYAVSGTEARDPNNQAAADRTVTRIGPGRFTLGESTRCASAERLVEFQRWSGSFGEEKMDLSLMKSEEGLLFT